MIKGGGDFAKSRLSAIVYHGSAVGYIYYSLFQFYKCLKLNPTTVDPYTAIGWTHVGLYMGS